MPTDEELREVAMEICDADVPRIGAIWPWSELPEHQECRDAFIAAACAAYPIVERQVRKRVAAELRASAGFSEKPGLLLGAADAVEKGE